MFRNFLIIFTLSFALMTTSSKASILDSFKNVAAEDAISVSATWPKSAWAAGEFTNGKTPIGDEQYSQAFLTATEKNGGIEVALRGRFWNSKDIDGDTYVIIASFHDKENNQIGYIRLQRGVNAKISRGLSGHTVVKDGNTSTQITKDQWNKVVSFKLLFGRIDTVNDDDVVAKAFEILAELMKDDSESSDDGSGEGSADFK